MPALLLGKAVQHLHSPCVANELHVSLTFDCVVVGPCLFVTKDKLVESGRR